MLLSIISINRNNSLGLEKTMRSVLEQTTRQFEYIVIDGASTDGSVNVIKGLEKSFGNRLKWISEQDKGIYNAMNKGIRMASGEYVQFLNSGDCLASPDVTEKMLDSLIKAGNPSIIYGNMLKNFKSIIIRDRCFAGEDITLLGMYYGCLNHSPAYIMRKLFITYGLYNEDLKICSDWEWYTKAIVLGNERPEYTDIDVTLFDMTGISETNKELLNKERTALLEKMVPHGILKDYDNWYSSINLIRRIKRYPLIFKFVRFIERCIFKFEKLTRKEIVKT